MMLDIQGNGYILFEIATAKLMDENSSEIMFFAGNLTHLTIRHFLKSHECNAFYRLIELNQIVDSGTVSEKQ